MGNRVIPPCPSEFEFFGRGPLKVCADKDGKNRFDIIRFFVRNECGNFSDDEELFNKTKWEKGIGFDGLVEEAYYALRIGSKIWEENKVFSS